MFKCKIDKILQIIIGLIFVVSGISKGVDPYGTALKITEYSEAFAIGLSDNVYMLLSVLLCGIEIFIGVMLVLFFYRIFFLNPCVSCTGIVFFSAALFCYFARLSYSGLWVFWRYNTNVVTS